MRDAASSPAAQQAVLALDMVEDVLLQVKRLPGRVDRRAIVSSLEAAIAALHRVADSGLNEPDHFDRIDAARACAAQAADTVFARDPGPVGSGLKARLDAVERALEHAREAAIDAAVVADRGKLEARAREPVPAPRPFRVSRGVPELHALERDLIRARVDTAAPSDFVFHESDVPDAASQDQGLPDDEQPSVAEDFDDEPEPELAPVDAVKRLTVLGERRADRCLDPLAKSGYEGEIDQLRRLSRDCIEEIGAMSNLRRLRDGERYRRSALLRFEQRMLDALDALVVLGEPFVVGGTGGRALERFDVIDTVVAYGRDALAAEPGRAFARTFALGCIAGDDAVRATVLALKQSHPYTYAAQRQALSLASNDAIVPAMRRLCGDRQPQLVALAVDVLAARALAGGGEIDLGTVAPLLEHPHASVRAAAARSLIACDRAGALPHLIDVCEREVEDDVLLMAYRSLVLLGHGRGVALTRQRLEEERDAAGQLAPHTRVALMQLLALCGEARDAELLAALYEGDPAESLALGFHGGVGLVAPLLARLDAGGSGFTRQRRGAARALWRITGAERQRERPSAQHDDYDLHDDHRGWTAWWQEHGERFDPALRHRFGQLHHPGSAARELRGENVPTDIRRMCADELAIALGRRPIPTGALVAQQEALLDAHAPALEAVTTGGRWPQLADA